VPAGAEVVAVGDENFVPHANETARVERAAGVVRSSPTSAVEVGLSATRLGGGPAATGLFVNDILYLPDPANQRILGYLGSRRATARASSSPTAPTGTVRRTSRRRRAR